MYRGTNVETNEWVYGYYTMAIISDNSHILPVIETFKQLEDGKWTSVKTAVDFDSVSRYTGFKSGSTKIYVGDVIKFRSLTRVIDTHTGDNIPNGFYQEPMEPKIEEIEGTVIDSGNGVIELVDEEGGVTDLHWVIRRWNEVEIKDSLMLYSNDIAWKDELDYLLTEYNLENLEDLIRHLEETIVVGNVYDK